MLFKLIVAFNGLSNYKKYFDNHANVTLLSDTGKTNRPNIVKVD